VVSGGAAGGLQWQKPEEIVVKLRQVDVFWSRRAGMMEAIWQIGISEATYQT
jgi:hypothetical protein